MSNIPEQVTVTLNRDEALVMTLMVVKNIREGIDGGYIPETDMIKWLKLLQIWMTATNCPYSIDDFINHFDEIMQGFLEKFCGQYDNN